MEKFNDEFINNKHLKCYKSDVQINIIELLEQIQTCGININKLYLHESSDLGMKLFEGEYSLENFLLMHEKFDKEEIENITIFLDDNTKIIIDGKGQYISVFSKNNIELPELIAHKKKL